jgi:hypothetical protein
VEFPRCFCDHTPKNGWVPDKDLDILDYPEMIADRYHIHNVEVQTMYLRPEASFIAEFRARLKQSQSKLVSIAAEPSDEVNQALGSADEKARANAVAVNVKWIDYAAAIGSPILMPFIDRHPLGMLRVGDEGRDKLPLRRCRLATGMAFRL